MQRSVMETNQIREVELALEKSVKLAPYRCLLIAFWGLILGKCLILEWATQYWNVPVQSVVYIWFPTLLFGALCTVLFARSIAQPANAPMTSHVVRGVWGGCLIASFVTAFAWLKFEAGDPFLLPAFMAIVIGLGYFTQGVLDNYRVNRLLAVSWWLVSLILFANATVSALLIMGLAFIVLTAVPYTVLFFYQRKI